MMLAEMDTAGQLQEYLTDAQIKCPECGDPMLGARICEPSVSLTAFIGVVCRPCDGAYHLGEF